MLPLWPEIVPADASSADDVLGVIAFGTDHVGPALQPAPGRLRVGPTPLTIPIRQLGGATLAEVWRSPTAVTRGRSGEVCYAANEAVLFGTIAARGDETERLTERLYEQIVDGARRAGYPHLLRLWNHVGAINEDERDLERYKRFSAGRHDALTRLGYACQQFPAASAVGMIRAGVTVYFIAAREPGVQVENPRQVAAYDYPPLHGPRSPSFSRATVARWNGGAMIFLAGTASVVGHETRHEGDVEAQCDETLRNIESIMGEAAARIGGSASLDSLTIAKAYIRRARDYEKIAPRVSAALPRTQILFVESDICRRDLLLEIEGVATVSQPS